MELKKLESRLKVLVRPHLNVAYKADLLALTVQEQINLGNYSGAKVTLKKASKLAETDFVLSKSGWIADYEGDFSRAKKIWIKIKNKTQDIELLETATHFLGRANWGLGNYDQALVLFEEDLKRDLSPSIKGFNHAWECRCYLGLGDLNKAQKELDEAKKYFGQVGGGIMAHYFLLEGLLHLYQDNIDLAEISFNQALKIRQSTQKYPKGLSDAQFGLALCAFSKGDEQKAIKLALQAISNQPNLINRKFV